MTEIATWQPPRDVAVQSLGEWARSAEAAHRIATTLVQTAFCPDSFRGKPGDATAAILAGIEVGLQPMAALRSFDIISGQAAPRAITLRAIVQAHGHEIELVESTATRCRMRGRRKGSADWQSVTWTIDRATQLGVTSKANWRNQPQAMLVARATGELARLVAADAILGLPYTSEEVADGATDAPPVVEVSAPSRVVSYTPPEAAPEPEPEQPQAIGAAPDDAVPFPERDLITAPQSKKLHALLREAGITDRQAGLDLLTAVTGREVASSKELTVQEASRVIEYLVESTGEEMGK